RPILAFAGLAGVRRDVRLRHLMLLFFLVMFCFAIMEGTLVLFCQAAFGFGPGAAAVLFTYVGILIALIQGGLLGRLVKRFGDRRLITGGIALMAAGLLLLPVPAEAAWLALTLALLAVGSAIHNPSLLALLSRLSAPGTQGETLGLARSCGALARVVGPLAGTWLFDAAGARWPFWSAGCLMLVALAVAHDLLRRVADTADGGTAAAAAA